MQSTLFTQQGTLSSTYDNNKTYVPSVDGEYPEAFSVGYVKSSNIPPQFIPSYFKANYAPDINTERDAELIPDIQDSVYDVFLGGLNNSNAVILNGDSITVAGFNTREYDRRESNPNFTKRLGSYLIYGECDVRGMSMPSAIQICIKFTGMKNGSSILYETVFNRNFNIDELIAIVKNNDRQYSITDGNITFNLQDFKDNRYLFVDEETDSGICGFYWLCYSFVGWGRNKDSSDNLGSYSYLFPSIGVQLGEIQETISEAVNKYATWNITNLYGTAPYGTAKRYLGGPGFRTRATGAGLYPGTYYEEEGISEIYQAELQNASYASFLTLGYSLNVSGFTCCAPIQPSTGSMISQWTYEAVREYATKLSPADEQLILFVPEGRGDFGTTVQIASINDAWKHACLVPVWCRPGYEYNFATTTENFWYAEMDGYEFVGNLVRGDDPSLQDKVPEWILDGDSTLNEYEPETDSPAGGGSGDDDPSATPNDPGKREDKIIGDRIGSGGAARVVPQSGVQYYVMTFLEMEQLRSLVWSQTKDFYSALNIINTEGTDTIFNYISSLRYYPFSDIIDFITTSSNESSVTMGTGAILQNTAITPYANFKLRAVINRVFRTPLCHWNLSDLPWRNNFLDFTPYSKLVVSIPYCGDVELDLNRVAAFSSLSNTVLWLQASGDIDSGSITFSLLTGQSNDAYDQILYSKNVKIAIDLPLSGNDQISQSNAILQSTYKLTSTTLQTASSLISSAEKTAGKLASHTANVGDVVSFATDAVQGVMDIGMASAEASLAKRQVPVSIGDINGTIATTQIRQFPYLTLYRQKTANPANYGHTTGFVCEAAYTLSQLSGFTILSNPDLSMVQGATQEELSELMGILTTGFYI